MSSNIKAVTLQNFKGFSDEVCIELRPITLLFGANSAGKSSVLQALQYVREILERQNVNADRTLQGGEAVDLGGLHKHEITGISTSVFFLTISLINFCWGIGLAQIPHSYQALLC